MVREAPVDLGDVHARLAGVRGARRGPAAPRSSPSATRRTPSAPSTTSRAPRAGPRGRRLERRRRRALRAARPDRRAAPSAATSSLCSAYKFFGPHVGLMYARRESHRPRSSRCACAPSTQSRRYIWETGTLDHRGSGRDGRGDRLHRRPRRAAPGDGRATACRPACRAGVGRSSPACWPARPTSSRWRRWLREQLAAIPGVTHLRAAGEQPAHVDRLVHARRVHGRRGLPGARRPRPLRLGRRLLRHPPGRAARAGRTAAASIRAGLAPYTTPGELERLVAAVGALARSVRWSAGG